MQQKISGEQPFQILSSNFTIGPSSSGYDLYFSADGFEYSKLFTVGADTNRQVTQVAAGSYYFLSGNTGEVTINWMKDCGGQGGGGSYVLPVASENTLGGVKIGSGITIDENGAISAEGGGSNDYYVGWDDLYDMDYAPRRAVFAEIVEKYNAGYHIYASGTTAASNGYDVILPLVEFIPGTWSTDRYNGGWAKFGAINASGNTSGYYAATFNSSGNISPNSKYFSKSNFYTLPTAEANTKGGIKVGSGLTMSGDTLSVDIGAGLAFSGNTIVATGGGGGGKETIIINDLDSTGLAALATRLFGYYDAQNDVINYPVDELEIYWWVPDPNYAGGYDDNGYKDYVKVIPVNVQETEWEQNGMWLSGPFSLGSFDGGNLLRNFRIIILEDGSLVGAGVDAVPIPEVPQIFLSRFGNDERGGLTYDADNDCFYYDSETIATGDTTTVYEDLIDNYITDWLISGDAPVKNSSMLYVIENGETTEYTHPSVSRKTFENPVTIDSQDFYKEVTFNYGDWKFTAYYGADDSNNGANLRISRV